MTFIVQGVTDLYTSSVYTHIRGCWLVAWKLRDPTTFYQPNRINTYSYCLFCFIYMCNGGHNDKVFLLIIDISCYNIFSNITIVKCYVSTKVVLLYWYTDPRWPASSKLLFTYTVPDSLGRDLTGYRWYTGRSSWYGYFYKTHFIVYKLNQ